ncbi:MAG: universal stress protein, partial [Proteobacteria bacterium]|nr:universal stress protein [Pseudomonadota bacterium]
MIENILIPTDGSDYGKTAIAYGVYFARKLNAQLTGLHVVDIRLIRGPVFTDISGSIGLPPYQEFLPAIESGLDAKADAILQDFRGQCEAAGVHPETKKVTGVIDETIIEE